MGGAKIGAGGRTKAGKLKCDFQGVEVVRLITYDLRSGSHLSA